MRALRIFFGKLFTQNLHIRKELEKVVNLQSLLHQGSTIYHSKLHTMVCHRTKLYPTINHMHYVDKEDGFDMVLVRAPPGAAETSTPGRIEWEKTVGSHVTAGEVVCRIVFKEDRSIDIKTPVTGIIAVRRKNEGDTVAHGDELFKIRLDTENLSAKQARRKSSHMKSHYENEEEIVEKPGLSGLKSSHGSRGDSKRTRENHNENLRGEASDSERQETLSQTKESKSNEGNGRNREPLKSHTGQPHMGLIPTQFSQSTTLPSSQFMTTINEVNMQGTINFANNYAGYYEVKHGYKPRLRSMYIKSAAHALRLNKQLNIKLINDERVEPKDLELTVGIRHLKVIVYHTLKNADQMSYIDISTIIFDIEKQIAAGTYKSQKGDRGFTVSPEWEIGSMIGTPAHSKTCTLGLHTVIKRPIFENSQIVAYPMMYVSLTYDPKLIRDENAVEYLKNFKDSLEDPRHILVH